MLPNVSNAYRGVESIEHHQRKAHMTEDGPQFLAIEFVSVVMHSMAFHLECLHYPKGDIAYNQKRDHFSTWFFPPKFLCVAGASHTVQNEARL